MPVTVATKNSDQKIKQPPVGFTPEPSLRTDNFGPYAGFLRMQRLVGNHAVNEIIQTKLTVSTPGDRYEQEADRVADEITDFSNPTQTKISQGLSGVHRKCESCAAGNGTCENCAEEEKIHRKSTGAISSVQSLSATGLGEAGNAFAKSAEASKAESASSDTGAHIDSFAGGGQPLPESVRAVFEPRFKQDFSHVRFYDGAGAAELARSVNARAFTVGQQMVFGAGQYAPHRSEGQRLIAHELVHTIQQQPFAGSPAPRLLQRQASPETSTHEGRTGTSASASASGLIVEDEMTATSSAQMKKSEFLSILQRQVCKTAEAALAGTGRKTDDCPYLEFWFSYYGSKDSQYIERSIRKYAPETARVRTARQYIPLITARVRRAVQVWVRTGKITGVPEGLSLESTPTNSAQGSSSKKVVQRKRNNGAGKSDVATQALPSPAQLGKGHELDLGVKSRMETAFGTAFSGIRLHTDTHAAESANRLDARAFTVGEHIAFGAGEYKPGTVIGDALIAHELAHTIQQREGVSEVSLMHAHSEDSGLENEADMSAVSAVMALWGRGQMAFRDISRNALPRLKSGLQLQRCRRSVKRCPPGKSWQVVGQGMGVGPTCLCVWRCLPGGDTSSYESSSGPSIDCYPRGSCSKPKIEIVDDDYKIEDQGSVTGVGGHLTPLGAAAMCGCLPLDIEGQGKSGSPLIPVGFSVTDVLGPVVAARQNRIVPEQTTETKPVAAEVRPATGASKPSPPSTTGGAGPVRVTGGGGPITPPTVKAPPAAPTAAQPPTGGTAGAGAKTTGAPPVGGSSQPKSIKDIQAKNAPARNVERQDELQKDINNYRRNAGIPRVDEPATPDVPVAGGTVAVARTNIKGLDSRPFGGASAEALPASVKGKQGTSGGTTLKPANPVAVDHAEHVALENLRSAIDAALESKVMTRQDLVGKNVWVRVEQEPCSSCAGGLTDPKSTSGPIRQFSERYPELTIEVRSPRASRSYYIRDGKPVP
jgi:Domain of unknown function (DUF4157)